MCYACHPFPLILSKLANSLSHCNVASFLSLNIASFKTSLNGRQLDWVADLTTYKFCSSHRTICIFSPLYIRMLFLFYIIVLNFDIIVWVILLLQNLTFYMMFAYEIPSSSKQHNFPIFHLAKKKKKKLPFNTSTHATQSKFDLIHCDIWGPMSTPIMDGYLYFLTIVDYSWYTYVFLLKN